MTCNNGWETGEYNDTIWTCTININGIAQDIEWIEWGMTLKSMYSQQINILGVTEPNINFKNTHVKSKLYDIAKSFKRNIQFSTSCLNQLCSVKKNKEGPSQYCRGDGQDKKGNKSRSIW
jgi:hypothetical protein